MKIYIAGPMTGIWDNNCPAFNQMEQKLQADGHATYNPARICEASPWLSYETVMKMDMLALEECDAIYLLPGWQQSKGATREYDEALRLGLVILMDKGEG